MRIAICEDRVEDAARLGKELSGYLARGDFDAAVEYFETGEAFLAAFEPGKYQIVFMDIYMAAGGLTGMQTAERLRERDPAAAVIFTTNTGEYGVAGYRVAVYYILKPVDAGELTRAMEKCRAQIERFARTIVVTSNRRTVALRLRDILYIESQQRDCVFFTQAGEEIRAGMTMEAVLEKLGGAPFLRCHRSFIVGLSHVTDMQGQDFVVTGGARVPISRAFRGACAQAFRELIRADLGGGRAEIIG